MVNRTAGGAMVMAIKIAYMAVNAFTGAVQGGTFTGAGGSIMTGLAASWFMDFTGSDKRRNGHGMTTDTVGSLR